MKISDFKKSEETNQLFNHHRPVPWLVRLGRLKLFDFEKIEDTGKLLKYRRVMLWIVRICIFTSIAMASGGALGLAFGFHTIELILLLISCTLSMSTFIPAVFCFTWIDEIEKILTKRLITFDGTIDKMIQQWALKMMFWAVLIVILPMLIRKFTGWLP